MVPALLQAQSGLAIHLFLVKIVGYSALLSIIDMCDLDAMLGERNR